MSVLKLRWHICKSIPKYRHLSTYVAPEEEYTSTPQYPEILDLSWEKTAERKKQAEYDEIKAVKTVEEKQIKLNMPKYYGFKCYLFREDYIPYNCLKLTQHVTRTHLIKETNLPSFYNDIDVSGQVDNVKSDLEEAILMELERFKQINDLKKEQLEKNEVDNLITSFITPQINRILINNLSRTYPHLGDVQVDLNSRIESTWYTGGMNPPENVRKYRKGQLHGEFDIDAPTNRIMNYTGTAQVALRAKKPLKAVFSNSDAENPELEVPFYKLDPRTVGTETDHRRIVNVPGFWPGDPKQFGLLSYHQRGQHLLRPYNDTVEDKEALDRQGILSSFGWLNAQANMLGFTTFNDITYPLVTQSVISNGQTWSFYVYQLNTIEIHSKHVFNNTKRNICWATPEMKLYEEVNDGKLVGFNDKVLETLLKFYCNAPEERLGINMTPYLSKEEKVCADYEDDDKRAWLEKEYKFLVSNRDRSDLPYEIYAWEKIYKIDHNTRFMDKKRRPFEFHTKPWNRKLNDRLPRYIPRALRPDLPRHKGRYAKEYFP